LGAKLAVSARIRARLAVLQTILAIADFHFLALDISLAVFVKTAFHAKRTSFRERKFFLRDTGVSIMKRSSRTPNKMQ
jgi:hypothetical protein